MIMMDTICARVYSRDDEDEVDKKIVPGYSWEVRGWGGRGWGYTREPEQSIHLEDTQRTKWTKEKLETRAENGDWRRMHLMLGLHTKWTTKKLENRMENEKLNREKYELDQVSWLVVMYTTQWYSRWKLVGWGLGACTQEPVINLSSVETEEEKSGQRETLHWRIWMKLADGRYIHSRTHL